MPVGSSVLIQISQAFAMTSPWTEFQETVPAGAGGTFQRLAKVIVPSGTYMQITLSGGATVLSKHRAPVAGAT